MPHPVPCVFRSTSLPTSITCFVVASRLFRRSNIAATRVSTRRYAAPSRRKQLGYEIELHHEELLDCVSATEEILDAGEEEDLV